MKLKYKHLAILSKKKLQTLSLVSKSVVFRNIKAKILFLY